VNPKADNLIDASRKKNINHLNYGKRQMKKYTKNYSQLSKSILEMSEDQQTALLKMAKTILNGKGDTSPYFQKFNRCWLVSLGVLSGWILSAAVIITFSKII